MKKTIPSNVIRFLTLIFLGFGIIGISNQAIAQDNATEVETEILGYWNQNSNDLPGGGFGFLADPNVFPQTADIGNATLSVGGGFLDTSVNASGDLIYTWLPSFAGTTANAQNDDPNGGSISMQGGTLVEGVPANNGSYLQFAVPMSGYENLNISYATRGTSTGFNTQTWSWSTDGTNFTNFATVTGTNVTTFFVAEATAPADLNGVETAYLRVVFEGATATTGNNRMDNILFTATPTGSGAVPPPAPVGFVMNPGAGNGQIFFAAGPNQVGGNIVYRLFYSLTSEAPGNPTTATEYIFGSTAGDGNGISPFGFTLSGLEPGASYTSWLYQYDTATQLFSAPDQGQATAGNTGGGGDDAPTVAAPTPTEDAANVISLFSNAYTNIEGINFNPNWGQSTQVEIIEIEGNTTLKYSNFNYQGTQFPAIDASSMTTVHLDMWTANATSVNFTIISPGPQEKLFALPITAGAWVSYEIPLSYFDNVNLSEIFQLKFDGGNGSQTIFLDNIYFSGEEIVDPVIEVGSIAELFDVAVPGDGVVYTLTNEVYLVFTSNFRGRKVVVDGTGGVLIDDPGAGVLSKEYNRYAGITGLTFQVALFGDTIQLIPVADAGEATSEDNLVLPRRVFISELGIADQSNLVMIENVTFVQQGDFANQTTYTIVDGDGNQMAVRTDRIAESILMDDEETYIGTPIPSDAVSLIGYISLFQGNPQLVIRKLDDIADASAIGAFSLVSPPNNAEVPLVAGSDNLVSIDWTTASGDDVQYLWFANASGLPLMIPAVAFFEEDSGFSISEGELVDLIESLFGEVNSGDSFTLDWAVYAFSNNGIRHSDQVWTVTFVIAEEVIGENVTFSINMSYQEDLGVFQPEVGDQVFVRGSFNGWSTVDGQELVETTPGIFEVTLFVEGEEGTEHAYKYYIMAGDGRTLPNTGWEVNNVGPVGDNGDRLLVLVGDDQVLDTVWFNNEEGTSAGSEMDLPMEFALKQNYPNPFNPTTHIQYALPQASEVRIDVFNVMGQRVATLVNGAQNAGFHTVTFDANRLASGVYIYRMQAGSFVQTQKMLLVK